MAKDLEKKIKEAKSEEELLKVLDSNDVEELTDEEMELIYGGSEQCGGTGNP
ncbi:MAG: bacteriocin [Acidaminococcaceae bacterium]|nr:bacteriocin [Acidaminococcaceae bacterium]